jgi:3-oxoacyl-[acyl-carrier protein] reductase
VTEVRSPAAGQRIVLVTGSTKGIGSAIADRFASEGARVIRTGTNREEMARLQESAGPGVEYIQADFSEPASLSRFLEFIEGLRRLDVCVNNAGINIIKPLDDMTAADFDMVTSVDYRAPFLISQAASRVMRRARRGWIVNVASIWSVVTKKGRTSYTSAKSGLAGMSRALSVDLAGDGILVNCVSPGFVMTDLTRRSLTDSEIEALAKQVPLGRFAAPAEIAAVVVFLASEGNTYLTGQNVVIDGGFTIT